MDKSRFMRSESRATCAFSSGLDGVHLGRGLHLAFRGFQGYAIHSPLLGIDPCER